jgi:transposase
MISHELNFDGFGLRVTQTVTTSSVLVLALVSTADAAACPRCGRPSHRVHSHYHRTVADLPGQDFPVVIRLTVRRFRCATAGCPTTIFCERVPQLLGAYARTTARLADAHRLIGFALGGEAGARLAEDLAMPTSPDTLLRRVKQHEGEPEPPPRFVGVDDWALRKGHRYGTIVIDLERGRVLDILPGRDGSALAAWLKEHPGVEVITRDRWAAFAQAAAEGAPQARQVTDRWHLLKNLREAVERLLGRLSPAVREALKVSPDPAPVGAQPAEAPTAPLPAPRPAEPTTCSDGATPGQQRPSQRQLERAERYERVRRLRAEGQSLRQIARATGLSVKCVVRYLRADRCPDWNPGRKAPTQLDPFAGAIATWVERGGRNAADLYRELKGQGCPASYDAVRRYLARRLGSTGRPGPRVGPLSAPVVPAPPSPRKLSFELIRKPEDRDAEEQGRLDKLRACESTLAEGLDLAAEFAAMARRRSQSSLAEWLAKAEESSCAELRSFAAGLRQDEAAVAAALTEDWSNGPVEGQVNRLKLIKRSMYGRAGFQLLRARLRFAS